MLSMAGIEFTDTRIGFAEWRALKPTTRWNSLPFLTLADGKVLGQARSMMVSRKQTNKQTTLGADGGRLQEYSI